MLSKLGKYEIRRELGRGAMGVVYEGYDPFIERSVAIKTINKSLIDPSEVETVFTRFRREAQAAGRLAHANIVSIYEYGEEGEVAYIAMELLAGIELQELLNNGRYFALDEVESIMSQLLDALEYSHNKGVVHRDIKPANILLAKDGSIKIADFGIAKIESTHLTTVGFVLGTPSYMSPEQYIGDVVDGRSDIYSAGVLMYQLLTGIRPFTGSNLTIIMQKVMHQEPVPPSEIKLFGISKEIDEIVKKALAKLAVHRFQTAAEFLSALKKAVKAAASVPKIDASVATLKMVKNSPQESDVDLGAAVAFDQNEFESRLDEARKEHKNELKRAVIYSEPENVKVSLNFDIPEIVKTPAGKFEEKIQAPLQKSSLLNALAFEAEASQQGRLSIDKQQHASNLLVHSALERVLNFFIPLVQHVNTVGPAIKRIYRLDARSVYANLKWQGAAVNSKKQSMSESALLSHVSFNVKLVAPEPVALKRPWGQFDALIKELHHLKIRALDDLFEMQKRPRQEWLETTLDPELPVQITFQANYELGKIEILTRNLSDFGQTSFRLEPADISAELLDELGLYLIDRTDKLPELLRVAQR